MWAVRKGQEGFAWCEGHRLCGSHLCTSVTEQGGGGGHGDDTGKLLGCAGQDPGHPQGWFFRGWLGLDTSLTHICAGPVDTWVGICFSCMVVAQVMLQVGGRASPCSGKHQTGVLQPCCGISQG